METLTLINDKGQYNYLISNGLWYASCNKAMLNYKPDYGAEATLEIVGPHDSPESEYHYFFDIRDCYESKYRKQGRTAETKLSYISEELAYLERMVNDLKEYDPCAEADDIFSKFERVENFLSKAEDILDGISLGSADLVRPEK